MLKRKWSKYKMIYWKIRGKWSKRVKSRKTVKRNDRSWSRWQRKKAKNPCLWHLPERIASWALSEQTAIFRKWSTCQVTYQLVWFAHQNKIEIINKLSQTLSIKCYFSNLFLFLMLLLLLNNYYSQVIPKHFHISVKVLWLKWLCITIDYFFTHNNGNNLI